MPFDHYLQKPNDEKYFSKRSLAYYYEDMERKEKLIKEMAKYIAGYDATLAGKTGDIEKLVAERMAAWDKKLQAFPESVTDLLQQWTTDGTIDQVIQTALIDEKLEPFTVKLAETAERQAFENRNKYGDFKIAIVDDDCDKVAYTYLMPLAESYGFRVTLAHAKNWRGELNPKYMTMPQIIEAHNRGHEICAHTVSHAGVGVITDDAVLNYELGESKAWLQQHGILTEHLMYPYGSFSAQSANVAAKYYKSAATSTSVSNIPFPTFGVGRFGIGAYGESDDLQVIMNYINKCKETNNMCVIMTHVGFNTPAQNELIKTVIDEALAIGAEFVTYRDLFEYHKNKTEFGMYTSSGSAQSIITQQGTVHNSRESELDVSINELMLRLKDLDSSKNIGIDALRSEIEIVNNEIAVRLKGGNK